jgi:hypothetical protein
MIRVAMVLGMTPDRLLMTPPDAAVTGGGRQQRVEPKGTGHAVAQR